VRSRRGVALLLALLAVVLGGAVLMAALAWTTAEVRGGRSWSDLAAAEAGLQAALTDVVVDRSLWGAIRPGETALARVTGPGPSDSTRVLAMRLGDSLGFISGQVWGPGTGSAAGLLVRLVADSTGDSTRVQAMPWGDRAWISLLPP
jgi:hypothetical protein